EHAEASKLNRPGIKENYLDIEDQEKNCGQIEPDRETAPRGTARWIAAFERFLFRRVAALRPNQHVDCAHQADDDARDYNRDCNRKPGCHSRIRASWRPLI